MTDRIISQLIALELIDGEEEEIYRFGLEVLLLKALHYASYLLIAALMHEIPRFFILALAFILLRKSAGGYHAKTRSGCYIGSCVTVLILILCIKVFSGSAFWQITLGCMFIILAGDLIIWKVAPSGNRNRILDEEENRIFKHRTRMILIFENISVFVLIAVGKGIYTIPIILAIGCEMVLLLLEKLRKGSHEIEQEINDPN